MSKRAKILLIKYGCSFLGVALFTALYVISRYTENATAANWFQWLCDGMTLPSILLLSAGLLIWISNNGAMDLLGYTFKTFIQLFNSSDKKRHGTYGDYVAEKKEKRVKGYGFLLISGSISMGLTLLFLVLYFAVS